MGMYVYIFVAMFVYLTFFSACCTVPEFIATLPDPRAPAFDVDALHFGIGQTCLHELLTAKYETRSCLVPCADVANHTSLNDDASASPLGVHISDAYLNFDTVLQVNSRSPHASAITDLFLRYHGAGLMEKHFAELKRHAYATLRESHAEPPMRLGDFIGFVDRFQNGLVMAAVVFVVELGVYHGGKMWSSVRRKLLRHCRW